jgi:hypothetical protein
MQTYYGLRTCDEDMQSHNGFQWPSSGTVVAPDWSPSKECGNGLHAFLNGEGEGALASWRPDAYWLVLAFTEYVDLGGKVKFPSCEVLLATQERQKAIDFLKTKIGTNYRVIGDTLTGGDHATLTGGYKATLTGGRHAILTGGCKATLTGGNLATLTGGYKATLKGGNLATLTGGDYATLTAGDYATLTGGYKATLKGGNLATLTGGDYATLTAGYYSTLTGGDYATLTGGDYSTLTGGDYATLTGDDNATLIFKTSKRLTHVAVVGQNGIQPNKPYKLVDGVITLQTEEGS